MQLWGKMFMKISTKGRYALRLMIDLAEHDVGDYIPLRDISERQEVSVKYLEQIVTALSRAGFLRAVRGAQGGYRLARSPEDYRVGDILRITEGDLAPIACLASGGEGCGRSDDCATLGFWRGLNKVINDYVDSTTLAQLVQQHQAAQRENATV